MIHKRLAAVLLALAAILACPTLAQAVTIHRHVAVRRVLHQRPTAPPIIDMATIVRVVRLAPPDRDDDGVANSPDACPNTSGEKAYNGCPPPAPTPAPTTLASAAPTTPTASSYSGSYSGDYSNVPGVPASFAACVAMAESSNGAGSSNIYGIIPASGSNAGSGTLAEQQAAFSQLYAQYGTAPWAPYDGC